MRVNGDAMIVNVYEMKRLRKVTESEKRHQEMNRLR